MLLHHASPSGVQKAVRRAVLGAGLTRGASCHTLRPNLVGHIGRGHRQQRFRKSAMRPRTPGPLATPGHSDSHDSRVTRQRPAGTWLAMCMRGHAVKVRPSDRLVIHLSHNGYGAEFVMFERRLPSRPSPGARPDRDTKNN